MRDGAQSCPGFWVDRPTKHSVYRHGHLTRVYERQYDGCMGGGSRLITYLTERDQERTRREAYGGARVVQMMTWSDVAGWEIEAAIERRSGRRAEAPMERSATSEG